MAALLSFLCSACLVPQRILTWGQAASLTGALRSVAHEFPSLFLISTQSSLPQHNPDRPIQEVIHVSRERGNKAGPSTFDMYGPPDWVDPALSSLPHIGLLQQDYCRSFIPSPYPFLAPHILVSEPLVPDLYPAIAWSSILECQDHDYGNRLIVADGPALGSPLPLVFNPAPQATLELADEVPGGTCSGSPASDVPALECDSGDESGRHSGSTKTTTTCLSSLQTGSLLGLESFTPMNASRWTDDVFVEGTAQVVSGSRQGSEHGVLG
ncbi:hypothetical protein JB92DRAFT_3227010 [Gautieria morchelliformis]|nr:hypothetical protein JB92DRAFT_3227010 [Gautieria morchelliformis]